MMRVLSALFFWCGLAGSALCQTMNISVYTDASYNTSNDIVYGTSSTDDQSSGCYHTQYSLSGYMLSPSGRYASDMGGSSAWYQLGLEDDFGDWEFGGSGSVYCSCIYGSFGYGTPAQYKTISNHVTYYEDPVGTQTACFYGTTACIGFSTAVCTGGLAVGPDFNPPQCPPYARIAYIRIRKDNGEATCYAVGAQSSSPGVCY